MTNLNAVNAKLTKSIKSLQNYTNKYEISLEENKKEVATHFSNGYSVGGASSLLNKIAFDDRIIVDSLDLLKRLNGKTNSQELLDIITNYKLTIIDSILHSSDVVNLNDFSSVVIRIRKEADKKFYNDMFTGLVSVF